MEKAYIIETERLGLRRMEQADFPALCAILQDAETMTAYEHAFSDEEVQAWLDRQLARYEQYGSFGLWAVDLKENGEMIGQCGLTIQKIELPYPEVDAAQQPCEKVETQRQQAKVRPGKQTEAEQHSLCDAEFGQPEPLQTMQPDEVLEIGYLFNRAYWHQGYAIEAAQACRHYAFEQLHAPEVCSIIRDNNTASQKVAWRNGMHKRGAFVKHYHGVDMPHDIWRIENPQRSFRFRTVDVRTERLEQHAEEIAQ